MEIGLNLFSIRNLLKTEEEFLDTAIKLKEAGYSYMQLSGAPSDPQLVKRVVEGSGLPIYLTHMPMTRIIDDTEALMEEHAVYGCKNIGLGAMPAENIVNPKLGKPVIEKLNAAGEKMAKNGYKFFYHHHHFELYKWGDETVLEYMIKNAPYINFTVDTYWLQHGGADVCDTLDKLNGRCECVHLKDYKVEAKEKENGGYSFNPTFAPLGDGNMDFKKIVKKMEEIGTKYYFVEQDNAANLPDTLNQVIRSVNYAKKEL